MLQANALLKKNLENAKASLEVLVADLQFLRDQQTITQVDWLSDLRFLQLINFVWLSILTMIPSSSGYNCSGVQLGRAPTEKQASYQRNLIIIPADSTSQNEIATFLYFLPPLAV